MHVVETKTGARCTLSAPHAAFLYKPMDAASLRLTWTDAMRVQGNGPHSGFSIVGYDEETSLH